ncbi:hypothetical protein ACFPIJ_43380 [Dactylosporangium cerinum]|uniref:Uncharacterized protein n=1 Tax=Dactylosporangium cerinum TaxID=1434730 RepID=A0ABV9WA53_9ACTN
MLEGPAYFDLNELRRRVATTLTARDSGVFGFSVAFTDGMFLSELARWFDLDILPGADVRATLMLDPLYATANWRTKMLAGYGDILQQRDLVCPVLVTEDTTAEASQQFWRAAQDHYSGGRRTLVLIFSASKPALFPEGLVELPVPEFEIDDINLWALRLASYCSTDGRTAARRITERIREAAWTDGRLAVRLVYEAMSDVIKAIDNDPDEFLMSLENGSE